VISRQPSRRRRVVASRRAGRATPSSRICRAPSAEDMFKWLLISVVIVPVLLGMLAATSRRQRRGLPQLLVFVLAYNMFYVVLLYYLRHRWVG
jgi:anti-sigma-K factor RskA